MTSREKAYMRKTERLIAGVGKLNKAKLKRINALLAGMRKDIAATVGSTPWQVTRLAAMKEAVDRAVSNFDLAFKAEQNDGLANIWNAGIDVVDGPLAAAGIAVIAPEISRDALEVLQGYSADLVGGLTADAKKKVNSEITMAVMGGKAPYKAMQDIDRVLGVKVKGGVSHRAETIVRTEMGRVHQAAKAARMDQVAAGDVVPKIEFKKRWIHSGKAKGRDTHTALDGVEVAYKEDFPGGILYPHAPGLPASEVANCGCTHILVSDGWADLPKTYEPASYDMRAIWD